jgi:CrcB protein
MEQLVWVGLGGGLGSIARYLISLLVLRLSGVTNLGVATVVVNLLGCLLIGFLAEAFELRSDLLDSHRLFLIVGFLGGLTTFSTFGLEATVILKTVGLPHFLFYFGLQTVLCIPAVLCGTSVYRAMH